jgi:Glyoxalase/Bleomycin resistance protein/Dioxygenase superfamily
MSAPTIDSIVIADPPETWAAAGFAVDDDGSCRVGSVRIRLAGPGAGKRIVSWALRDVPPATTSIDGLPTEAASTQAPSEPPQVHDNGVEVIDHLVILSPDVDRTIAALGAVGIELRATRQVDQEQYGFEARQTFFRMGEVILELIGPNEPMDDAADRPAGFFGLAYTVHDLDATAALLTDHIGRVKDAVQPGRMITTLRHKDLGMSVATAFMSAGAGSI